MRLRLLAFSAAMVVGPVLGTGPAFAQGYSPPPVDYAGPSSALSSSGAAPSAASSRGYNTPEPEATTETPEDSRTTQRTRSRSGRAAGRTHAQVGGYLEVQQVLSTELSGGNNDVLTYTSVAAGVEGSVQNRRVAGSFGARYERRIDYQNDVGDQDVVSGVAQVQAQVVPGSVQLSAGALATRTGGQGGVFNNTAQGGGTQLYSGYVGPDFSTRAGPVALTASYRLGYAHVDDDSLSGTGTAESGSFDSTVHSVSASAGMSPGEAPIGWTIGGGYMRESSGDLGNRFENAYVRGDVVVPLGPTVAATAGVGYARTRASQQDVLRGPGGLPVLDARGNFIANPAAPRLQNYDSDGLYYDAGVLWRPNHRTELQVRAGADQDGNFTVAGSASTQIGRTAGASLTVYDHRESFGSGLINNLRNLPTNFQTQLNPLTGSLFGGCVFGDTPGQGQCFAPQLQSLSNQTYRARGAQLIVSGGRRLWSWGLGATYSRRDYYQPADQLLAQLTASSDQDASVYGNLSRRLSRSSSISLDAYASWYDAETAINNPVFSSGFTVTYNRQLLLDRLEFLASVGLAHTSSDTVESDVLNALVGLRYGF